MAKEKKPKRLQKKSDIWPTQDPFFSDYWESRPAPDTFKHWPKLRFKELDSFVPVVNVKEDDKAFYVEVELPGLRKEDIEVSIQEGNITIRGEKKTFKQDKKENFHRIERSYGSFYRSFPLPVNCDSEQINAIHKDGLLTVTIKKKKGAKETSVRKITVN
jgi:HSP20 family protein